ncbi:exodeoxyribonuclease V subunit gamma [Propionicicella superfundia]|uniref:exodeoxyribonuclease V subunit gamma n=1 Tax=Propionicicella superfundia TaxID=348582 RepID=UPI00041FFF65|nr:exodeoxyribonuclease V subunit gamma [Propionicicella superfundia]
MEGLLRDAGVVVHTGTAESLVAELAAELEQTGADPFATETVCVNGPGMARWAASELSRRLGSAGAGDGICAGVATPTLARFTERIVDEIAGVDRRSDPWSRRRLTGAVLQAMRSSAGEPWFDVVARHLGTPGDESRPGRWHDTAARVAGLFRRYWTHRPGILRSWTNEANVRPVPAATGWQAELWRRVRAAVDVPDPEERLREVCTRVRAGRADGVPDRLFILAPSTVTVREADLLAALADVCPIWIGLTGSPAVAPRHPLAAALGRESAALRAALCPPAALPGVTVGPAPPAAAPTTCDSAPRSVLAALQADILADRAPVPRPGLRDASVQLHLSHGADRQVEVLREVLTGLFADDPTLEPRDVAVLTPDPAAVAPLVKAAFCLPAEAGPTHPGHRLRVRVAAGGGAAVSPLLALLVRLLDAVTGRLTLAEFADLAGQPAIARRFHLSPEDLEDLTGLLQDAGVRWGLDAADRARFGLGRVAQNTFAAGLDRLLLGVALAENDTLVVGGVVPMDGVESTQLAALGRVAELLARLGRLAETVRTPRSAPAWADALRIASAGLTDPGPADAWQASALAATLADLAQLGDDRTDWAVGDVQAFLEGELHDLPARNPFGNGSLLVTDLTSLRSVPHRVVAILGIDEQSFPRITRTDGDDLLSQDPQPLDPDRRRSDRQALLDAVLAARDHLVVVGQGADPATNTEVPLALPLLDLIDALRRTAPADGAWLRVDHPLYPYSPASFTGPVGSFDSAALAAAGGASPIAADPWRLGDLPPLEPGELPVRTVLSFLRHPLRELLKVRCGLSVYTEEQVSAELPIELDGLGMWSIGERMLARVRAGQDVDAVLAAERARGSLPPGALGDRVLDKVSDQVRECLRATEALATGPSVRHDLAVTVRGWTITGSVDTVGQEVQLVRFSKLNPGIQVEAWLSLLLLQATHPDTPWRATTVTRAGLASWQAGTVDPRAHLDWLLRIYRLGMSGPVPLPLGTAFAYARDAALVGDDAADLAARNAWRAESAKDEWWPRFYASFADLLNAPVPADLGLPVERSLFGTLARCVWAPILGGEVRHDQQPRSHRL